MGDIDNLLHTAGIIKTKAYYEQKQTAQGKKLHKAIKTKMNNKTR